MTRRTTLLSSGIAHATSVEAHRANTSAKTIHALVTTMTVVLSCWLLVPAPPLTFNYFANAERLQIIRMRTTYDEPQEMLRHPMIMEVPLATQTPTAAIQTCTRRPRDMIVVCFWVQNLNACGTLLSNREMCQVSVRRDSFGCAYNKQTFGSTCLRTC